MGRNVGLTNEDKDRIVELYQQGLKCKDIGDMFGVSKVRVGQIAHEAGLKRQDKVLNYSKEDVQIMYDLYMNGQRVDDVADKYGFNRASVYNLFKKYGFVLDEDRYRLYTVNDAYFDVIDTPNKAYILGFLWADGHNKTSKGIIEMRLQERDKHILEDISAEIKNDRPLYFVPDNRPNSQDTWRMIITSRHMSDVLVGYGMCSNKTYILQWPSCVQNDLIPHFLRGFTDGDGHIGERELSWAGTQMMLTKIQEILLNWLHIESHVYDTKTPIIKTLRITKKQDVFDVVNWIYQNADLKLNRKFLTYQQIISLNNNVNKDK